MQAPLNANIPGSDPVMHDASYKQLCATSTLGSIAVNHDEGLVKRALLPSPGWTDQQRESRLALTFGLDQSVSSYKNEALETASGMARASDGYVYPARHRTANQSVVSPWPWSRTD